MKEIPLAGKYSHMAALVDDEDYETAIQHSWQYRCRGRVAYAWCEYRVDGVRRRFGMHRFLTGWKIVDHINHNGLDNRRANLREATPTQNFRNQRKRLGSYSSQFKGVGAHQGTWRAYIKVDRQYRHIGCYTSEVDAARAYDRAARELHGEFACLNFPDQR